VDSRCLLLFFAVGLIVWMNKILPSELSPLEDRSALRLNITGPEGASYEYMDNFMDKLSVFVTGFGSDKHHSEARSSLLLSQL